MEDTNKLKDEVESAVSRIENLDALEAIRISELGKNGRITLLMKGLGQLEPAERKLVGKSLNELKSTILDLIEKKKWVLESSGIEAQLTEETIDVSLPVRPQLTGSVHPISQTIDEVTSIFGEMGFSVEEGPDIEEDWYNFTALNIPPNHPARQEHDTF